MATVLVVKVKVWSFAACLMPGYTDGRHQGSQFLTKQNEGLSQALLRLGAVGSGPGQVEDGRRTHLLDCGVEEAGVGEQLFAIANRFMARSLASPGLLS